MNAEAAWNEHSIGFTWRDEEQRYGEYRAFLAGFEAAARTVSFDVGGMATALFEKSHEPSFEDNSGGQKAAEEFARHLVSAYIDTETVETPVVVYDVEFVRNGVCLLCGDGVLNSGEHIDPERHAAEIERITSGAKDERTEKLEKIRKYAEERAAYMKHPKLNTVGSGRIASDLFQILEMEWPEEL